MRRRIPNLLLLGLLLLMGALTPWAGQSPALFAAAYFFGGEVRLDHLNYDLAPYHIRFENVRMRWQIEPEAANRFSASSFQAQRIIITQSEGAAESPTTLPQHIVLPFPIRVDQGEVEEILWRSETGDQRFSGVHFSFNGDMARVQLKVQRADTPWGALALHVDMDNRRPFPLTGTITLEDATAEMPYHLQATLSGTVERLQAAASIELVPTPEGLRLLHTSEAPSAGRMEIHAEFQPFAGQRFSARGRLLQFNSRLLHAAADGRFNLDWTATGTLEQQPQAHVTLALHESQLHGQAISGEIALDAGIDRIQNVDGLLRHDGGDLRLHGALGGAQDKLDWHWQIGRLEAFGPQFAGRLDVQGSLLGSLRQPTLELALHGRSLKLPKATTLERVEGQVALSADSNAPLRLDVALGNGRMSGLFITAGSLQIDGTRASHQAEVALRGDRLDLQATLHGGLQEGMVWDGQLLALNNRITPTITLEAPARLYLSPEKLALGGARFSLAGGRLDLVESRIEATGLQLRGAARDIALAEFAPWLPKAISADSSLALAADWNIAGGDTLDGDLTIWRSSGDLVIASGERLALGLSKARLQTYISRGEAYIEAEFAGDRAGELRLAGSTRITRRDGHYGIAGTAPINFTAQARVPSIHWLATLQLPPALSVDGAIHAELTATGTASKPQLDGQANGSGLRLSWPEHGMELEDGRLAARFDGERLHIDQLGWQTGQGHFGATGWLQLTGPTPSMQLDFKADRFALLARTDQFLTVSGQGALALDNGLVDLSGELVVDEGLIELPPVDRPALGEDVVVLHRPVVAAGNSGPQLGMLDIAIGLGDKFRLRGRGLDTELGGALRLRGEHAAPLAANGQIKVIKGTYLAYGQTLQIERGILNFDGPLDNPGINIRAMRDNQSAKGGIEVMRDSQTVKAGVEVTGSAQLPAVRLVSEPEVSDNEKMSWLVFGHGIENTSRDQLAMLSLAAGALLTSNPSEPLQTRLTHAVGLDEFGISSSSSSSRSSSRNGSNDEDSDTVVSFGKRLSSNAYVSYERGLSNLLDAIRLTYRFTPRWSLRLQGGSENAADMFYTFTLD